MSSQMRIMPVKEFVEEGFLQELNRQFLHPRGLALSVTINNDGSYKLTDIFDARDDPEGYAFDDQRMLEDRKTFQLKATNVEKQYKKHAKARRKLFNRKVIQPIPPDEDPVT